MSGERWTKEEAQFVVDAMQTYGPRWTYIARIFDQNFPDMDRNADAIRKAYSRGFIHKVLDDEYQAGDQEPERQEYNEKEGSTYISANRPYSADEMADLFEIDTRYWRPWKRISNVWHRFFQTKIWWERIPMAEVADRWDEFLEEVRAHASPYAYGRECGPQDGVMYELNLSDAHLGMLGWGPETGADYDLYIGLERYQAAIGYLRAHEPSSLARYLLVVGQDLTHFDNLIDGKGGSTAKGTPQDVDTRWQKLFVATCKMLTAQIEDMLIHAPVDIVVQPGNHDTRTTFYIGEYLKAYFSKTPEVRIDNTPKPRKYVRHGTNLIGFAHKSQKKNLGNLMASEAPHDWAETYIREWHLGHLHHEAVTQDGETTVRVMRALTSRDAWHVEGGYLNIPGAHGFVWHPQDGLVNQVYYTVPKIEAQTDNMGTILK